MSPMSRASVRSSKASSVVVRLVDGNEVCLMVNYITRMDGRLVTPVVYWMRVDGGKICSIETFFDARGYDEMYPDD